MAQGRLWFNVMTDHGKRNFLDEITRQDPPDGGHKCTRAWEFLLATEEAYEETGKILPNGQEQFHRINQAPTSTGKDLALGRRSTDQAVEISIRGTLGLEHMEQWLGGSGNLSIAQAPMPEVSGKVHKGYLTAFRATSILIFSCSMLVELSYHCLVFSC